jgi:hypothetical protein
LTTKLSSRSVSAWRATAIISIVGHILTIWFSSFNLRENISIFYWQRFSVYFLFLRIVTFVIALIAIWFSSEPKVRDWMTFLAIIGSCCIFGFVNYTSFFVSSFVDHIGTVELKDQIYQLVSVAKYDDETTYYFGACDQSGYVCTFHQIYSLFLFEAQPVSKFEVSDDGQKLIVKLNEETIYNFDGEKIICKDSDYGYCINNIP